MAEKQGLIRKFIISVLLIALLLGLFVASFLSDRVVHFPDENLEMEIRTLLNNYSKPIYQSQLLSFIELDLSGKRITNISGLEHFRHLEVLNLANNFISDLSPLKSMNNLRALNVSNNGITDLEEANFEKLTHIRLVYLNLSSSELLSSYGRKNRLSNIELLSNFIELEILVLSGNLIQDLSPLSNLTKLRELNLRENFIQVLSPLHSLKSLQSLDISRNKVVDISVLNNLNNLIRLNLRGNKIEDISPLIALDQLEYLNLHSNAKLNSIQPIGRLAQLSELIIENISVGDEVGVLENLQNLKRLNISNCQISDYSVLGNLMKSGALQDDPTTGVEATLSIRGNLLPKNKEDPLDDLRPYWENISNRDPFVLPTIAGRIASPNFSQDGGYFTEEFNLSLTIDNPNLEIYYTLDGSDPDPKHVGAPPSSFQVTHHYSGPITVANRSDEENVFSEIKTTHVENQAPWTPPISKVFKGLTVRGVAYDPDRDITSEIVTNTYFVDENIFQRYPDLPVISLTADYDVLFKTSSGILNTGRDSNPFYHKETRVPANIELIEPDGDIGFSGLFEIKLHGFTSVANPQKGFHVYAEPWLGNETINYPIFQDAESKANHLKNLDRFILRAWGTAFIWDAFFSDAYHQTLLAKTDLDIQGYQPAILFINGEYWGLYEIREANKNLEYFTGHYFQDEPVELDILELGTIDFIEQGDPDHWKNLMGFLDTHDIRLAENYAYLQTQMDVDNFIQYVIHCIFTGKMDWPGHNEAMWRPRTPDGKWRWIQFDMDQGLRYGVDNLYDMVDHVLENGEIPHPLLITLLENDEFKTSFLNNFAHMMNTYFRTSVEVAHFTEMAEALEPYIPEYLDRWQPEREWAESKNQALQVIENRWVLRKNQILDNFSLNSTSQVQIMTNSAQGNIAINGFVIDGSTPGVVDPGDWTGVYFDELPISFSAIPNPGFQFVRWESSRNVDPIEEDFSLVLEDDLTVKAIFEPIE